MISSFGAGLLADREVSVGKVNLTFYSSFITDLTLAKTVPRCSGMLHVSVVLMNARKLLSWGQWDGLTNRLTKWLNDCPTDRIDCPTDRLTVWVTDLTTDPLTNRQIITCRSISEYSLPESSFEGATLFLLKNFRDLLALTGDPRPLSPASTGADLSVVLS